ncbi:flagellar export protein FliJ [Noviherbaspirillum galbum]|uniref:Flagellar FliJ protein n=1 Tax=Noviherbaspirillum galbum TaxID=2709383 RepID=A0A6B3SPD4_9BURK|nr:flagellar export protein FliJ [Noviherbaspirillum galbum]NEX62694.1 flagella biosynthesis chaperone FliJ [Noviherbaspirillum galbum]
MAIPSALDTLIELATNQSDEAARRLGRAVKATEDAEQKLQMLLQYREDYYSRFQAGMANGLSMTGYRNFQLFLDKLDAAIGGQQKIVEDARRRKDNERHAWQVSERKRMSFETLSTRAAKEQQRKENKREQKLMDEYATRLANQKR